MKQAVASTIAGRKKLGYVVALACGYADAMIFWVFGTLIYVGGVLVDNGTLSFLNFFQAFFAVIMGAMGVGKVQ